MNRTQIEMHHEAMLGSLRALESCLHVDLGTRPVPEWDHYYEETRAVAKDMLMSAAQLASGILEDLERRLVAARGQTRRPWESPELLTAEERERYAWALPKFEPNDPVVHAGFCYTVGYRSWHNESGLWFYACRDELGSYYDFWQDQLEPLLPVSK